MSKYICYCFQYTQDDIINDIKEYGKSMIPERIVAAKRLQQCNCVIHHPQKR